MSCCVDKIIPNFTVEQTETKYKISINYYPKWSDYFSHKLRTSEYFEKICEIADEIFHLFSCPLKCHIPKPAMECLVYWHHVTHRLEHTLHAFCFLNDILRIKTGKYTVYSLNNNPSEKKIDYLRTTGRVCHTAAHFLYSSKYLVEMGATKLSPLKTLFHYMPHLSAGGYLMWSISLIWNRSKHHHFKYDLAIHITGFMFETIPLCKNIAFLKNYADILYKISCLATLIHASLILREISPKTKEKFYVDIIP